MDYLYKRRFFNFGTQHTVLIITLKNDDRLSAAEQSRDTKNRQTEEQMTHWDILNEENSNLVALLNMSQCVICSPVWRFFTT